MEANYEGYKITATRVPLFGERWCLTLAEQPWQPAIGETGLAPESGEMSESRQEQPMLGVYRFGDLARFHYMGLKSTEEKPVVKYIHHLTLIIKNNSYNITSDRDKLFDALRVNNIEVKKIDYRTLCIYTTMQSFEFMEFIETVFDIEKIESAYNLTYKGKVVPVVRCVEEKDESME